MSPLCEAREVLARRVTDDTSSTLRETAANPERQAMGRSFPEGGPKEPDDANRAHVGCNHGALECLVEAF